MVSQLNPLLRYGMAHTILILSSAIGKRMCAAFPIASLALLIGSSTTASGIKRKLVDTNANFEEFEVDNPDKRSHIKAQTLTLPPIIRGFNGNRGQLYDQEQYKGRAIFCTVCLA
jgi:hypothetical protein